MFRSMVLLSDDHGDCTELYSSAASTEKTYDKKSATIRTNQDKFDFYGL